MTVTHKPIELIQAQVAGYAAHQSESLHIGRGRQLLATLGEIGMHATGAPDLVTFPRSVAKKGFVNGEVEVIEPVGAPIPLFEREGYTNFLKDPRNREQSYNLAEMIKAYG